MIEHAAVALYELFRRYGLAGIAASMFIENVGIPLPTELGYLAAVSIAAGRGYGTLIVLAALTVGHLAGSVTAYVIGRRGDAWVRRRLAKGGRFAETHDRLIRWYGRYGAATIFATRFIGYVRPWSSFVAGFAAFPLGPFVWLTALGSFIFNVIALFLSQRLIHVWQKYPASHLFLVIGGAVCLFGFLAYELLRRRPPPKAGPPS